MFICLSHVSIVSRVLLKLYPWLEIILNAYCLGCSAVQLWKFRTLLTNVPQDSAWYFNTPDLLKWLKFVLNIFIITSNVVWFVAMLRATECLHTPMVLYW